jgi:hypothetical protein
MIASFRPAAYTHYRDKTSPAYWSESCNFSAMAQEQAYPSADGLRPNCHWNRDLVEISLTEARANAFAHMTVASHRNQDARHLPL